MTKFTSSVNYKQHNADVLLINFPDTLLLRNEIQTCKGNLAQAQNVINHMTMEKSRM